MNKNIEDAISVMLSEIGEDPFREGLVETPKRYANFMKEFLSPPKFEMKTFSNDDGSNEMIVVGPIPFFSLCEHHLAPFFGEGYIGYIPDGKIVGLSKLPRTLELFSRRLQNQERLCRQVGQYIYDHLNPVGCGVYLEARHLCMEMRGVKKSGVYTVTTYLSAAFKEKSVKDEFLNYIK